MGPCGRLSPQGPIGRQLRGQRLLHYFVHSAWRSPSNIIIEPARILVDLSAALDVERQMIILNVPESVDTVSGTAGAGANVAVGARNRHRTVNRRTNLPQMHPGVVQVHPDRLPGLLVDKRHPAAIAIAG